MFTPFSVRKQTVYPHSRCQVRRGLFYRNGQVLLPCSLDGGYPYSFLVYFWFKYNHVPENANHGFTAPHCANQASAKPEPIQLSNVTSSEELSFVISRISLASIAYSRSFVRMFGERRLVHLNCLYFKIKYHHQPG